MRDLDLLIELGLGIDRRLTEERAKAKAPALAPAEVSFWYITNHLGRRFLRDARERLDGLEQVSPGVWRSQVLRRSVFLIDSRSVPVDRETVALHLVGEAVPEIDAALARVIVDEPGYWHEYAGMLNRALLTELSCRRRFLEWILTWRPSRSGAIFIPR